MLFLLSCWLGFERGHLPADAYLELFQPWCFLSLFQWIRSPAKGAASVQKGRTLLSQPWLPVWSLLQNVISSWREKDTETYDVVREAQNNVSLFKWQTSQMGAASSIAEKGWFKMIK